MSKIATPHFELTYAKNETDIEDILALQAVNLKSNVSQDVKDQQGFVTVRHEREQLKLMLSMTPQVIARADGKLAGFALAMLPSMGELIPDLQPMFEIVDDIVWNGERIYEYKYYIMGQICVAEEFRGQGVFEKLYQTHKNLYKKQFDLCITEISTSNKRSQRAHEKVGFQIIHQHIDHVDDWYVVAWELNKLEN